MSTDAQIKMKALVAARLLMGDLNDWNQFKEERETANKIINRRLARSVSSQIGHGYGKLSSSIENFMIKHFSDCSFANLAQLCDTIVPGCGMNLRLDEFERVHFRLNDTVKSKYPFYTHMRISCSGLQFEFPEHHFLNDIEVGFIYLKNILEDIIKLKITDSNLKEHKSVVSPLISREKFISRSLISASFSLVESYVSGIFYTVVNVGRIGITECDPEFINFAKNKESGPLKDRLGRIAKFASNGTLNSESEPFDSFIKIAKRYRDAIHHTTPFGRKDIEIGERLETLYEIDGELAILFSLFALDTVLKLFELIDTPQTESVIFQRCRSIRADLISYERSRKKK